MREKLEKLFAGIVATNAAKSRVYGNSLAHWGKETYFDVIYYKLVSLTGKLANNDPKESALECVHDTLGYLLNFDPAIIEDLPSMLYQKESQYNSAWQDMAASSLADIALTKILRAKHSLKLKSGHLIKTRDDLQDMALYLFFVHLKLTQP